MKARMRDRRDKRKTIILKKRKMADESKYLNNYSIYLRAKHSHLKRSFLELKIGHN